MTENNIRSEKITKPIQLLAVWFSGLVILVSLLLAGAKTISTPAWITPLLVISAILIIPLFLYFVFLLQTKYRPQMQEDSFYSKYLDLESKQDLKPDSDNKFINAIAEIENKFQTFSQDQRDKLQDLQQLLSKNENSLDIKKITKVAEELNNEVQNVENLRVQNIKIRVNRTLQKYKKILFTLVQNNFEEIESFKNENDQAPEKFLISIGINIEPIVVLRIL
jgi:hypothetical protein